MGRTIALIFVGIPFVARSVQPVLKELDPQLEEAANLFGAVSVVNGHIRGKTNTPPLHIEILYNEYNFTAVLKLPATATAFLRHPELFSGMLSLPGVCDAKYFFDGWLNPVLYENSPVDFLANMPPNYRITRRKLQTCRRRKNSDWK